MSDPNPYGNMTLEELQRRITFLASYRKGLYEGVIVAEQALKTLEERRWKIEQELAQARQALETVERREQQTSPPELQVFDRLFREGPKQ